MQAVIFDFDGTLADSVAAIEEVVNIVLEKYKYKTITQKDLKSLREKNTIQILKEAKIPFWKLPFMMRYGFRIFDEKAKDIMPFPNIQSVFERLKKDNIKIGIVSSNSTPVILRFLEKYKFPEIDFLYTSRNLLGKSKMIKSCIKRNGLKDNQTIYVGDEVRDVEACKKIGITCISVTWGFNSEKALERVNQENVVANISELMSKIEKILNEKSTAQNS